MEKTDKTAFSKFSAIFFIFFGALIFADPNKVIALASTILGILLICAGVYYLIKNYYATKENSDNSPTDLILGIVTMILGLLFIILAGTIGTIIQYILGAWILFSGIERLITAVQEKRNTNSFIAQLIVAILLIFVGLYTIFKANLTLKVIGLIMMIYGVIEVIGFITESDKKKDIIKDAKVIEAKTPEVIEEKEIVIEDVVVEDSTPEVPEVEEYIEEVPQEKVPVKKNTPKRKTTTKKSSTSKKKSSSKKTTTKKSSTK